METGFRAGKGFRARTTSADEALREVYHQYAVVLEKLWTLHNMGEARRCGPSTGWGVLALGEGEGV